jgi:predicted dehydrogenase
MKIGIVGCGMISGQHLAAAARYPRCEIVGVVDRDIARARAQAERYSVKRTFDNLADLMALRPDVVHVLTPPVSHRAVVLEALQGGANVYVEKPMAMSVAECDAMTQAAVAADREICVGHNWLYSPAMIEAQQLLATSVTGQIVQAAASYSYDVTRNPSFGQEHWAKELPGGLAEDLAVHPVSLLIRLLGPPQRTFAVSRSGIAVPNGKTADVRALLDAEHGLGTIAVSLRANPDMALLDIWCERVLLRLNISSMTLTVHRELPILRKIARGIANIDVAGQLIAATTSATWKLLRRKVDGSYGKGPLIHAFYAAIEAGNTAPVGPAEGTQAVSVLRSIWPSAELPVRAGIAQ